MPGSIYRTKFKPIFIIGYMHSGTTLLVNIFMKNPLLHALFVESNFFGNLPALKKKYPALNDRATRVGFIEMCFDLNAHNPQSRTAPQRQFAPADVEAVLDANPDIQDHIGLFFAVTEYCTALAGKTHWLEKTPNHVFYVDAIAAAAPDARFVHIIRDPRDVLASKKHRRRQADEGVHSEAKRAFKKLEKAYDPLWDSLSWKSAVLAGNAAQRRYTPNVMQIRYEDLVQLPEASVRDLCAFAGLTYDPSMLETETRNSAYGDWKQRGITTSSLERWKERLSAPEVALIQLITRPEARRFGYTAEPHPATVWVSLLGVLARSGFEFFLRLYRRWRMGGLSFLRAVLGKYLRRFRTFTGSRA